MAKSKAISVRLNLKVAEELEYYSRGTWLSKNLMINRGARLYIQLLQLLPESGEDMREVMQNPEFWKLMKDIVKNRKIYWRV